MKEETPASRPHVQITKSFIWLHLGGFHPGANLLLREKPEGVYWKKRRLAKLPTTFATVDWLARTFLPGLDWPVPEKLIRLRDRLESQALGREVTTARHSDSYPFVTDPSPPFPHQIDGFNASTNRHAFALLFEMGTGKTRTSIDIFSWRVLHGKATHHLVVAPKSGLHVWKEGYETWCPVLDKLGPPVLYIGTRKKRAQLLAKRPRIVLVNYDLLRNVWAPLRAYFAAAGAKLQVTLDESDTIKNPAGKATRAAWRLGDVAACREILTGTVQTQDYRDLYPQYRFLDHRILGLKTFAAFKRRYCVMGEYKEVVQWRRLDELKARVNAWSMRVLASECLQLPPKLYTTRWIELLPQQRKAYEDAVNDCRVQLEEDGKSMTMSLVLTVMLRLQQITSGFVKFDDGTVADLPSAKEEEFLKIIDEVTVAEGHKVAVQCVFRHEMRRLARALKARGVKVYQLHGDVGVDQRRIRLKKFNTRPGPAVMLCQIAVTRTSISLVGARYVVRYTHTFSLRDFIQFEARAHRYGQEHTVNYIDLLGKDTVDESIMNALVGKADLASYFFKQGLNGATRFMKGHFNVAA